MDWEMCGGDTAWFANLSARLCQSACPAPALPFSRPPAEPPQAWGGAAVTVAGAGSLAAHVAAMGGGGMMLWSLQASQDAGSLGSGGGGGSGGGSTPQSLSAEVCRVLGLANCSAPLFP